MALLLSGFAGCNTAPESIKIDNALTAEEIAAARLTPEVMWKMSRIGSHALSPDGKTLLYTLTRYNMEALTYSHTLYIIVFKKPIYR